MKAVFAPVIVDAKKVEIVVIINKCTKGSVESIELYHSVD